MASAKDHPSTEDPKESKADAAAPATTNGDSNDNEQRPSDSSQPSSKKRRPGIQLNKDDHPEGRNCDSDEDADLNDEGGSRSDPFKRASGDVIKKRKIVKASNKWSGGTGATSGGGAFASVKLAPAATEKSDKDAGPSASTFGSGAKITFGSSTGAANSGFGSAAAKFGASFGGVSHGFGALNSSSSTDKPKGGFGAASTGFGSLKSSTTSFGFGSTANANATSSDAATTSSGSGLAGTFAKPPNQSSNASPSKFPTSSVVDTANGEQDEDCLCQVRAKLFRMLPEDETPATVEDKGEVLSVPSSSGRMQLAKAKKGDEESSPEKANDSSEKAEETAFPGEDEDKPKLVQKEAGIGPVRVLKRKSPMMLGGGEEAAKEPTSARVVQRQETSMGKGVRVILNVRLVPKTCNVIRRGDTFVQLNAPNSEGTLESSLFKVKTAAEAETLYTNLKAMLEESKEDAGEDA